MAARLVPCFRRYAAWSIATLLVHSLATAGDAVVVDSTAVTETFAASKKSPMISLSKEARRIAAELDRTLPAGSEARAMYDDIVSGRPLGPDSGWFPMAAARTRFDWTAVKTRFDRDGDDAISPEEFGGSPQDFDRLDRDGDGRITEADLTWAGSAQTLDGGLTMFRMADRDVDGKISPVEWSNLFERLDRDGQGFLTIDDLRSAFAKASGGGGEGPSTETLLRGLLHQEVGALQPGPALNEPAPDFALKSVDGSRTVTLAEEIGPQPIVLMFGTFTCGPFRAQSGNVEKLARRYKDRARFLMVYVREAHPTDGWRMESNDRAGVSVAQPRTYDERVAVAKECQSHLAFSMPCLVDTIDDQVGGAYSGMPSRLYVIDGQGCVAYKSGRGPFGFKPAEMEQSLIFLLAETPRESVSRP